MAMMVAPGESLPYTNTKRKARDSPTASSKRVRVSVSPDSDAEDSDYSNSASSEPQDPILTPLTPFSPNRKFPSDLKTHHCPYDDCLKSFNRPARLVEHLRSHTNERPFKCKFTGCDKDFLRETHLAHHVKSAHTDVRDYSCEWEGCGKKFLTATRLRRHEATHEGREKHRCTQYPPCNETFRKHSTLQKHITSVHLNQKPYPCTQTDPATGKQCAHGFETAGKLRAHEGRIHGGARFWCSECTIVAGTQDSPDQELGFPTYTLLQEHIRTAHPPTCGECSQRCSTQRELKLHIEIQHGGQSMEERKTHICTHPGCGRGFTKKGNLMVHMRTVHEGKKRFICGDISLNISRKLASWDGANACGGSFTTKGNLEEHIRSVHLGIANTTRAKNHRRTHHMADEHGPTNTKKKSKPSTLTKLTGVGYAEETGRTITCPENDCAYRFLRAYDLEVHLGARHGLTDFEIDDQVAGREGQIWVGEGYVDADDELAEREIEREFDVEAELERMALEGGDFWLSNNSPARDGGEDEDQLELESVEMRRLLEGRSEMEMDDDYRVGGDREDEVPIDPVLRYLEKDPI
ncbi:MAG: Strongly-conserved Zn-finger binding protein (TFIIIA) [Pleopsidium flavum]|nr:MAG: Strongly-conserved Zn-finger binding protein (TFIIIA) [Pleopsidium flavum]